MENKKFSRPAAQKAWTDARLAEGMFGADARIVRRLQEYAEQIEARQAFVTYDGGKVPLTDVRAARILAERIAGQVEYAETYSGCAEPGYDDHVMVLTNWNGAARRWQTAVEKLERLGCPIVAEWEDEWTMCTICYKGVRTSPDSYGWTRYYWYDGECDIWCGDCVRNDPTPYVEWLVNRPERANTILDSGELAALGWERLNVDFENGYHHGMDADPKRVLATLRGAGVDEVLFDVYAGASQFYVTFHVWVKPEMVAVAEAVLANAPHDAINGPSISGALSAALRQAARTPDPAPASATGFTLTKVGMTEDGAPTVEKRWVTGEEFIAGIKL